ncbi:primosomal protein N' [Thioalkalivibrio sp.]|uniref:primosomal protein N' n=2 Tax=Thioalkalivibrio sp. TaxID=2093813 RepID=UPI00356431E4
MRHQALVRVAVDRPLDQLFDYACPVGPLPEPGQRVRVTFGRSEQTAVVMETGQPPAVDRARIRPLERILDPGPILSGPILELLRFASRYYHHPIGETVLNALPPALRKGAPLPSPAAAEPQWRLRPAQAHPRLGPRQRAIVQGLETSGTALALHALADLTGLALRRAELKRLADLRVVEAVAHEPAAPPSASPPVALTPDQRQAVTAIEAELGTPAALLLDGVTGSGKTEVYLEAAATAIARGLQVLVLVPEIALTPQLVRRVSQRFPGQVAALHSGLPAGERLRVWDAARRGARALLLGTRSALFTPLPALGLLIVDEEHDPAYKQQDGLRYHARDLAIMRGHIESVPVVLGSATPTLESLAKARDGHYRHLPLGTRPDGSLPPPVRCVDTRVHRTDEGLTTPLLDAMRTTLAGGRQCFVLLNRRGFARVLACEHCGWVADCPHCDARLTVHAAAHRSICHLCGFTQPLAEHCPECGQLLSRQGLGTQRLERALSRHFAGVPLVRLDRDSIRRRGELERCLEAIRQMDAGIVVGTQMLAKGHDFPRVGLVGVIDVDQGLFSVDLRAAEQTLQLVQQAAGRAGRSGDPGIVLVQTGHPEHPLMQALQRGDYASMVAPLLAERRAAGMPPFGFLALVRVDGPSAESSARQAEEIARQLRRHARGVRVLGPAPAPRHRVNRRYREQILLASPTRKALHQTLAVARDGWQQHPPPRNLRVSIDVDPATLA